MMFVHAVYVIGHFRFHFHLEIEVQLESQLTDCKMAAVNVKHFRARCVV